MSTLRRIPLLVALAAATALVLAGCTSAQEPVPDSRSAAPTPSASARPAPLGKPTNTSPPPTLVLEGTGAVLSAPEGSTRHPYDGSPDQLILGLTNVLGVGASGFAAATACNEDETTLTWDGLAVVYPGTSAAAAGRFRVDATGSMPTDIEVTTPYEAVLDGGWDAYFAKVSGHRFVETMYEGYPYTAVVDDPSDRTGASGGRSSVTSGVIVGGTNGVITRITAPSDLYAGC